MKIRSTTQASRRERFRDRTGQSLVEFTMVIPFVVVLLMALLEFTLALNASLAVTRASQHGAHLAASAGNDLGSDCLVLDRIESDLQMPNDPGSILEVVIERAAMAGNVSWAQQTWSRTGNTLCSLPNGAITNVPYTLTLNGYPANQRCTVLSGCPAMTPARSTVDNIGVTVRYTHGWVTPLSGALDLLVSGSGDGGGGGGWTFEQRNIFRMEPTL